MNKTAKYTVFFLGSLLFVYTTIRAYLLSITWDEAYSYLYFVRKGIWIEEQFDTMSANNHLLITWLNIILINLFDVSEFILRVPSLLGHLLFLVFSAKLVSNFKNKWLVIASFLILNLNPYLLDFFSLARGYGLSLGLMMTSVYYLKEFSETFKNKHASISLCFASLAVLANFVLLNYVLALFSVLVFLFIYDTVVNAEKGSALTCFYKKMLFPSLILLLLLAFVVPVTFCLKKADALFYGGETGFWHDTVSSIVQRSFYELDYSYWLQKIVKGCILLTFISACILLFIRVRKRQFSQHAFFFMSILLIVILCIASIEFQHRILETNYVIERTALFILVLFCVLLVAFINELSGKKRWMPFIAYVSAFILIIHIIRSFNLNYVLEWKANADTKEMLRDLEKIKSIPKGKSNISINISLFLEADINFYRAIHSLNWLNPTERTKIRNRLDDYYYLMKWEFLNLNPDSLEVLKTYPVTQNVLVRPKYKPGNVAISMQEELGFENEPEQQYFIDEGMEFSKGFTYIVNDSATPHKNAVIVFEGEVKAVSLKKSDIAIVISMENAQGNYFWKRAFVMDYLKDKDQWNTFSFSVIVPAETRAGDKLSLYLWNFRKQELLVKKMRFKWLEYQ